MSTLAKWIIGIVVVAGFAYFVIPHVPYRGDLESPVAVAEASYPEATNYAVDVAGVITPEHLAALNTQLKGLDNGNQQIAVLILKSTQPLSIEEYGIKLAEKWKVGKAGLDNGAIVIVATEDRKVRIEVGYGLEDRIPDAVAGRIIDENMIPSLKTGDWYGAVTSAVTRISQELK